MCPGSVCDYFRIWSCHPGGAQWTFVDGPIDLSTDRVEIGGHKRLVSFRVSPRRLEAPNFDSQGCVGIGESDGSMYRTEIQTELRAAGISTDMMQKANFMRGRGCNHCRQTGFRGRIGIYELMKMTSSIRDWTSSTTR